MPVTKRFTIVAELLALAIAMTSAWPVTVGAADTDLTVVSRSLRELTSRVAPAVVQVATSGYGYLQESGGAARSTERKRTSGSGVLLTADGYLVTNYHVVAGAKSIHVILTEARQPGSSRSLLAPHGKRVEAALVGLDAETDLAVVKVEETGLPHLELGDSDEIGQGQIVLALGSPMGLENSVTMGVVSSVARQLEPEDPMVYIQTDAPINPGNSGGPLLDVAGRVVGINTLILSRSGGSEGIGFAAPSNIVKHVFEEIRTHGRVRRGEVGVFAQTISPTIAWALGLENQAGVLIGDVTPGSPADAAGIKIGDIVATLDGKPMENGRQFAVNLYRRRVGSKVRLDVGRAGARRTIEVEVVERDDDIGLFAHTVSRAQNPVRKLGVLVIDLTDDIVARAPWLRNRSGVGVLARAADAPSGEEGPLAPPDVIHAVNGKAVNNVAELRSALADLEPGDPVALLVNRRGQMMFIGLEVGE